MMLGLGGEEPKTGSAMDTKVAMVAKQVNLGVGLGTGAGMAG